ncbi:MAG TPA: GNAT family N-acetyltransferase [Candidatus Binatia bacterium]|jgi:ribosomal protein S18 acetylase RimI-like enzyme
MQVQIRPAAHDDLDFVSWVMFTAARSHLERSVWEAMFDRDEAWVRGVLRRVAVSEQPHWCHLSKFRICEVDGQRAGALAGYDPVTEGTDVLTAAMLEAVAAAGDADLDLEAVLARADIADSCTPKKYPGAWGVENVAVVPELRSRGVLDRLMENVLAEGRGRGFGHAQIMVLAGNTRAQKAYERNGFAPCAEYRSVAFEDAFTSPGINLLVRAI